MLGAGPASAAVTVGSSLRARADLFTRCDSFCTELQVARPGGLPAATIPSDGVITRWRVRAATQGLVRLRILQPLEDGSYVAVAESDPQVLQRGHAPGRDVIYEFAARIPVREGDQIALDRDRRAGAVFHSYGSDASYATATFAPVLGDAPAVPQPPAAGRELLLNADLERDADHDGLGDESQDSCPQVPADTPDVPCPPREEPPPVVTPVGPGTQTGTEGPTVTGEGGPSRPTGRSPRPHSRAPKVRHSPRRPVVRNESHRTGRPVRGTPPRRSERTRSGHTQHPKVRPAPPRRTERRPTGHAQEPKKRATPPHRSPEHVEPHARKPTRRQDPPRPKGRRNRRHATHPHVKPNPPKPPAPPGFEPH
ncbi:hypothetical protein [Capillimicrobium parvum]|uniref:hypothetical protein n=1 Tax=Capillimicrobium parvum TaxID=2884022 RepID=UPI00216B65D4|nr:hypothetical protein [Capillimicrobium parvum]